MESQRLEQTPVELNACAKHPLSFLFFSEIYKASFSMLLLISVLRLAKVNSPDLKFQRIPERFHS